MTKVCHMTSAHEPMDDRIFLKECQSLSKAGYNVYLVAQGKSTEKSGIKIVGAGEKQKNRIKRILVFSRRAYKIAKDLDCDIYHFHDPELLPYGLKLKRRGKKVIFDSHEDVPAQILDKTWIPFMVRKCISKFYKIYETHVVKNIDAVVTATSHIAEQFEGRAQKVVVINNYPKLDDIMFHETPFEDREPIVCYAGGISELRGEKVMIEAMEGIDATLVLAGPHSKSSGGGITYTGMLDRKEVNDLYAKAVLGLVLLLPASNYKESLPIKMFEYMAAGLPFVATDFPLWKAIAEETQAGLCVDINNKAAIRKTITSLLSDRKLAQTMGNNGRKAVEEKYNWAVSCNHLISLYVALEE